MTDLRDQVVEAMAQALCRYEEPERMPWFRQEAAVALDAALDVLGERWEEWIDHTADFEGLADLPTWEHGLLAVLRAGKGSDAS